MRAKLYSLSLSHPAHTARLMLEHKGIEHEVANLLPGFHPLFLRLAGFRGPTVPALRIDGRRIQGTLKISRALEELRPAPALYPADPDQRRGVEEAERWGEAVLQPVPRRIFRWMAWHNREIRRWMAKEIAGMPAPGLMAIANAPIARSFALRVGADEQQVRSDLAALPRLIEHVNDLIADGTIGRDTPNAADFQIATGVRVLLAFEDLKPGIAATPAADLAMRLLPDYPGEVPALLPRDWLPPPR